MQSSTRVGADTGVWKAHTLPSMDALWGLSLISLPRVGNATGGDFVFGGEHRSGRRSSALVGLDCASVNSRQVQDFEDAHPAARRWSAGSAIGHSELLIIGGLGSNGFPVGDAWVGSLITHPTTSGATATPLRQSVRWTRSGLEQTFAALMARTAHTITALPAPFGPNLLRGAADAAFLIFGGLSTARVSMLARGSALGKSTTETYGLAASADAREPDASLTPLNDMLLLTRGAAGRCWHAHHLRLDAVLRACPHPGEVPRRARACGVYVDACLGSIRDAHASDAPLSRWHMLRLAESGEGWCEAVGDTPLGWQPVRQFSPTARRVRRSNTARHALQPEAAADWSQLIRRDYAMDARISDTSRTEAPCPRAGHVAHLYVGQLPGLGSLCGADGRGSGCLLIRGGSGGGSDSFNHEGGGMQRLSDLWALQVTSPRMGTREAAPIT